MTPTKRPCCIRSKLNTCEAEEIDMNNSKRSKRRKVIESVPEVEKLSTIKTRCAPGNLVGLVNKLEDRFKDAINKIGFGWVFQLKCTRVHRRLCKFLVMNFDTISCCLNIGGSMVSLSPADVHCVLGVPCSGADVQFPGKDADHDALYVKYFGSKVAPTVPQLHSQLTTYEDVDEGFIVRFVMFVLGTFLCPTTSTTPKRKLIGCFVDFDNIGSLNWAKLVLTHLASSISKYHRNKQHGVGGCMLFLQLYYYERFCTDFETPALCTRPVPRIRDWGDEQVCHRQKLHRKSGGYASVQLVNSYGDDTTDGKQTPNALGSNGIPEKVIVLSISQLQLRALVADLLSTALETQQSQLESFKESMTQEMRILAHGYVVKTDPQPHDSADLSSPELPDQQKKDELAGTIVPDGKSGESNDGNSVHGESDNVTETEMLTAQEPQNGKQDSIVLTDRSRVENLSKNIGGEKPSNLAGCCVSPPWYKLGMTTRSGKGYCPGGQNRLSAVCQKEKPVDCFESVVSDAERSVQMELDFKITPVESMLTSLASLDIPLFPLDEQLTALEHYIFDEGLEKSELMVNMQYEYARRLALMTLKSDIWIVDTVITLVTLALTAKEGLREGGRRVCYLPTLFGCLVAQGDGTREQSLGKSKLRETFLVNSTRCEKLFIPLNSNGNHWYLLVINFPEKEVVILDSNPSGRHNMRRVTEVKEMLAKAHEFFQTTELSLHTKNIKNFLVKAKNDIPLQENANDCGVYLIKYMQTLNVPKANEDGFMPNVEKYRKGVALALIMDGKNQCKEDILNMAKQHANSIV